MAKRIIYTQLVLIINVSGLYNPTYLVCSKWPSQRVGTPILILDWISIKSIIVQGVPLHVDLLGFCKRVMFPALEHVYRSNYY